MSNINMTDTMQNERKLIVVNLYAPPGTGKSTGAAYIFSRLKMMGVNAELITEFAKDKVWERNGTALMNQIYVFAHQYYKIYICEKDVDIVLVDSPLLLSCIYRQDREIVKPLRELINIIEKKYVIKSYFINRTKGYNPKGRIHSEKQSDDLREPILNLLKENHVDFKFVSGDTVGYEEIIKEIHELIKSGKTD